MDTATRKGRFSVFPANTLIEKNLAYQLRYQGYKTAGYIDEAHTKLPLLKDSYDSYSQSFLLFHKDKAIGTLRITLAKQGPLEIEQSFSINRDSDYAISCEFGRMTVLPHFRERYYSLLLVVQAFNYAVKQGIRYVYIEAPLNGVCRYYEKFGAKKIAECSNKHPNLNVKNIMMLKVDLGKAWSLRRTYLHLLLKSGILYFIHVRPFFKKLFTWPEWISHKLFWNNSG